MTTEPITEPTADLLWPDYATPDDLAAIEAVPLQARGLPEIDLRAARPRGDAVAGPRRRSPSCPTPARWQQPLRRTFAELLADVHRYANLLHELGRAPRRRGRPDGPQLRRADHRDPGRAAGRHRGTAQRRACRRRTSASCCAAPAPACSSRPGPSSRRPPGTPRGARRATACSTPSWSLRPTARQRAHPSRCPPSPGCASATSARPPARDPSGFAGDRPAPADLAALFHTGGTTGAPEAGRAHPRQWRSPTPGCWPPYAGFTPESTVFAALPLFHVNALVVTLLMPLFKGQQVVWAGPLGYRDPALYARFWKMVRALPDRRR